jgi:cobalt-zinc-cadmium efflux system membrane fusion protein
MYAMNSRYTDVLVLALSIPVAFGCHPKATKDLAPYSATKDEVLVRHATPGIVFKTVAAKRGEPLPTPPITARVTTVEALTEPVFSPLRGRVAELRVRLGEHVKKGEHLMLVQTPELPELTRQRQEAKLSVALKQSTVDRLRRLVEARAVPEHDLDVALTELETAKVDVLSAEAKLRSLSVDPAGEGAYWMSADRDGTVVEVRVSPGAAVGPDLDHPVYVIADLREVLVIGDVPQAFAGGLEPNLPATVRFPGQQGTEVQGTIQTVSGVVDAERQSVPVRVLVPNSRGVLRPNAYVELELRTKSTSPTLLVPTASVVTDGLDTAVFVKRADQKFQKRRVTVGRQNTDFTEILTGIESGEEVVVTNPLLLINALEDS